MINGESTNAQDARLEELWRKLDTSQKGYLDLAGLKKGLRKMDHPLKRATTLLEDVLRAIDTNHDGVISYSEFHDFVQQTEQELWNLFNRIDHNGDGKLDQEELQSAFKSAGLAVSNAKLQRFFDEVDSNHDGSVTFDEWRDFLLFVPASEPNLHEVLSYYSSTRLTAEGDIQISNETKQGIGTTLHFLRPFFGTLIAIAQTPPHSLPTDYQTPIVLVPTATIKEEEEEEEDILLKEPQEKMPQGYFIAGGAAGIISRTATAPLDRLKVYLIAQTDNAQDTLKAAKSGSPMKALQGAWRTASKATLELWAAGGIRSLFAGNGLNIVKVVPESSIKFGCYEIIKTIYIKNGGNDDTILKFWAGGVSGMIAQFAVYPLDTLKFRMQCETVTGGLQGNKLIFTTARKMWKANGLRSYYRGVPLGVFGMFPYAAIDMGTFELCKKTYAQYNAQWSGIHEADAKPGSFGTMIIGGVSGAIGSTMVYPLNVLRTRLQSQGTVLHPRTYTGITDVFRQTIKGEGVRGLFKGLAPNLVKVVPSVSIGWVVYEGCKKKMDLE